jgi:hypothetical protein
LAVDPEMDFSGGESSDFDDVYHAKEDGDVEVEKEAV